MPFWHRGAPASRCLVFENDAVKKIGVEKAIVSTTRI